MKSSSNLTPFIAACALVSIFSFFAFLPGLGGPFLFDDFANLVHNPTLLVEWGDPLWSWWAAAWSSPTGGLNRPVAMLSFAVDHAMWGLDPGPWKRTSLLIHCINTLLTFALSNALLRMSGVAWRPRLITAALLALVWAVHPLQVSTVLYVVQRMELLGHTFGLLALLCYVHARHKMIQGGHGWPWLIPSALAILLGTLTKETVAIVPALAIVLELMLFRFGAAHERNRRWLFWLSAVGITIFLLALSYLFIRYANAEAYVARDFTWFERLLTEQRVLAQYIRWILVPIPTAYLFYYDHLPISTSLLSPVTTLLSTTFLLALAACAWWLRERIPLFAVGIAWFFLGHLMTAGPIPLEIAFEHRNYGPSLGLLLAVTALLLDTSQRHPTLQTAVTALAGGFVVLCLLGTTLRAWEWGDPIRLISNTASRAQESSRAQHNYGTTMILQTGFDASNPMFHIGRNSIVAATKLPGARPQAQSMLIEAHTRAGLSIEPTWWQELHHYIEARDMDHHASDAVLALVTCRLGAGCPLDDRQLQSLLALATEKSEAQNPDILLAYGDFAFNAMDDWDLAERLYRASVEAATRSPHFRTSLARFLLRIGKLDEAETELQVADNLDRLGLYRDQRELVRRSIEAAKTRQ